MKKPGLILTSSFLSILSLLFYSIRNSGTMLIISRVLDILILLLIIFELYSGYRKAEYRSQFIRRNIPLLIFSVLYPAIIAALMTIDFRAFLAPSVNLLMIITRSLYLLYRSFENIKSLEDALAKLNDRPALAIISSFLAVIAAGTLLLMLPFSTADRMGLSFIDSWFTATSAVCVTGLIVLDTATAFSLAGKIIILILIQTGGLGIMIMSYFSMFILGRRITIEEKKRLSFVISDSDMSGIVQNLKKIIYLTFSIETAGAILLFLGFGFHSGFSMQNVFPAIFHSISAFCNAGFSLFSNSLENFAGSPFIIFTVSVLIILGGLSFAVIFNLNDYFKTRTALRKLNLNTKIVITWTGLLIFAGFLFFYASEHGNVLRNYDTATQYLGAFFQSVTLRTAGFNSVPFSSLSAGTVVVLCLFMFIGGASGSTAGGVKINTIAVIFAYLKSVITNSPRVTLYRYQLSHTRVLRAFVVLSYGITAIFAGMAALALTNDADLTDILFETVSAFGTVGLSTGLTPALNSFGKMVIIFLMFNGRLGPLTILSTFTGKAEQPGIEYPRGDILIG
jgi:trk system potassium uptake protein TrkH